MTNPSASTPFLTILQPDNQLVRAPDHLSYAEAAALPVAGGTASNALFYGPLKLEKGTTVLAQGTGGVSSFVIQVSPYNKCSDVSNVSC